MFSDESGYYTVVVNGTTVLNTEGTIAIESEPTMLTWTAVTCPAAATIVVNLYTARTDKQIRHLWIGTYEDLYLYPNYTFDPLESFQEIGELVSRSGSILKRSPRYTHRKLVASFQNISPSLQKRFERLMTYSFYAGQPFWFFWNPTDEPTQGALYWWNQEGFTNPYTIAAQRSLTIDAIANYSPSRSPDSTPFAFTKALSLDGSTQYGTCTSFSCGTKQSIEFWIDTGNFTDTDFLLSDNSPSFSGIYFDSSNIGYSINGDTTNNFAHGGLTDGTRVHFVFTRNGTSLKCFKNGVQIGSTITLAANNNFEVTTLGAFPTPEGYLACKIAHVRIYSFQMSPRQILSQYNQGRGNFAFSNGRYAIWECDESGGTSTTEDNAEGTAARDFTLTGSPSRVAW